MKSVPFSTFEIVDDKSVPITQPAPPTSRPICTQSSACCTRVGPLTLSSSVVETLWWLYPMPESTIAMPTPLPSRRVPFGDTAFAAPVVNCNWLEARTTARLGDTLTTSARRARSITREAGTITATMRRDA